MSPKRFFFAALGLTVITWSFLPQVVFASKDKYFDFGPYYNQSQVLGFSFSSLENLPAPKIPDNIMLQKASGLLPGSPLYPLEKITENIQLAFTFDPVRKEELRLGFASERLSEAKTLMEQGKIEAASSALDSYSQTFKDATNALSNLTEKGNTEASGLANKIEEVASAQVVVAQNLALSSAPAEAEGWNLVAKTAQRALDSAAEAKGEPAIPEDLSTSIQKIKEQGLISEEESNKLYSLENRSQVREELDKLASSGQFPASELIKLDTAVASKFPDVHKTMVANTQVAEIRVYQTLPQPSEEILDQMKKWQESLDAPPSNDIKPYLWHNRAEDLAKVVDLSNFTAEQQGEVAKFYSQAVASNPTYIPPPNPSISPSPTPPSTSSGQVTASDSQVTDQNVSADPYIGEVAGVVPGNRTYFIKRWGENVRFTFTFDSAEKARLKMQQAERRLAEAAHLSSDSKKSAQYEGTIKDYQRAMADASSLLKVLKDEEKAREVAVKLENQAARHEAVLEKGLLSTPKDAKLITEAIKATEDALDRSADTLGRPALPPALSDRLGDLKAQGLILPEEAEDLVRSNSREEAREKIRKLVELGTFPPADSKKLDEAQVFTSPSDYNQLVEVRKVEELQNLRATQTDLAQTPTLKAQATQLDQKTTVLTSSFDPTLIKLEDLGGRENLVKAYEKLSSVPRPINGGQFGAEATPGAKPVVTPPSPRDAVLTTCPEGATFKQFEGCVWADTGRKINDYDQYKCDGPKTYYSFAAKKCIAYDPTKGYQEDSRPICPVGYQWSWQAQGCQTSTGGILPYPSPSAQPEPKDDQDIEKRSKSCPEGSSYKPPQGCVWDQNGKSVYDPEQYRCSGRGQYYSFKEQKCVASPKAGEPYPDDIAPDCKEPGAFWNWSQGKCAQAENPPLPLGEPAVNIDEFRPPFIAPNSPFYIIKQATERVQLTLALTAPARGQVSLAQAKERLNEAADALKRNDESAFKKSIDSYTYMMQNIVSDTSKEQLTEGAKIEIGKLLSEKSVEQNLLLTKLQAWAPKEQDTAISAAVSASILGVDKAADIAGEPPIPDEVRIKIEGLPEKMISEEDKKKLLEIGSRVEARLKLGGLIQNGALTQTDAGFLNEDFDAVDQNAKLKVEELKKLEEIAAASDDKDKLVEKVTKNEEIVQKLQEFEKTFEAGKEVPAEIRPYVRLTRINEVAQTVRPDIVKLEDFQNRKDVVLAVATLQEEFKPTKESIRKVEEFRRRNPNGPLPPHLARIEALSFTLGVREQAGPCYLPTPPFAPNTPCPSPGAAIPINSYYKFVTLYSPIDSGSGSPYEAPTPSTDKDGKPLIYGQGPTPKSAGVCQEGYHWMYDSGGWCMSNSGSYNSSYNTNYTPSGPATPGYTPYTPYYTAPGASPATSGYPVGDNSPNDGCQYGYDSDGRGNCIRNSYPSAYSYSPPSYYGSAPTYYTTNPPAGTVPGSGPKPSAPGQCPTGFHWMSDSGGWCMADGPTYVPSGQSSYPTGTTTNSTPPTGGYNCGSQPYDPVTKKCKDGACPGGFNWNGSACVASGNNYSPNLTQSSCGPGYYWDGKGCIPTGSSYSGWSGSSCNQPSGGCGSNYYWDSGSCSCRPASSYSGGAPGPSPSNYCQGVSCGGGTYLDYSSCSCKSSGSYSSGSGSSYSSYSSGSTTTSSGGCANVSASSCGSGWYFDSAACTCRQSTNSSTTSTSSSSGGGSSSGSCPSGYHWMSENGGWCMQDGAGSSTSSSGGSTSTSTTTSSPTPSDSTPSQQTSTSTTPSSSEPAPAPSTSTSTESSPPPSE